MLNGRAYFMDTMVASSISSREGKSLSFVSSQNLSISVRNSTGREVSNLKLSKYRKWAERLCFEKSADSIDLNYKDITFLRAQITNLAINMGDEDHKTGNLSAWKAVGGKGFMDKMCSLGHQKQHTVNLIPIPCAKCASLRNPFFFLRISRDL